MAEKAEYTISLNDLVSAAAKQAGGSLEQLRVSLGHVEETTDHLEHSVEKLKWHEVLRHSAEMVTGGFRELASGVKGLNVEGVIGGVTEAAAGLAQPLDLLVPGLGEVAEMAIKAAGGLAQLGVGLVDTALETREVNEKLEATFEALGDVPGKGEATLGFLNDMAKELPQSRTQLADWTRQFEAMGVTDLSALREEVKATASAQAIMGDQGAAAYQKLTERVNLAIETHTGLKLPVKSLKSLYDAGINVTDVADRMGISTQKLAAGLKGGTVDAEKFGAAMRESLIEKGAGPLEKMGDEIGVLKEKFGETLSHLFDDVDTAPITDAIKSVIDLGDQGEPSGQALKAGMTGGINGIVKEIGHLIHEGELMFLDLEIGWLKNKGSVDTFIADAKTLAGVLLDVAKVVGKIVDGVGSAATGLGGIIGKGIFAVSDAAANNAARNRAGQGGLDPAVQAAIDRHTLPGHATGGIVTGIRGGLATVRPAHGEGLASIGQGEQIVPRDSFRGMRQSVAMSVANDNAKSNTVHIEHLTIQAPGGITNAHDVTVTGLTLALERLQLASGR